MRKIIQIIISIINYVRVALVATPDVATPDVPTPEQPVDPPPPPPPPPPTPEEEEETEELIIIDIIDRLEHHPTLRYRNRKISRIKKVIVHHSATLTGSPESFARYHVRHKGWPGIGYMMVIAKDGTTYQTNKFTTASYHCSGQNTISAGICLVGHFDKEDPTPEQYHALRLIIDEFFPTLPVEPHNKYAKKTCPGTNFDFKKII